ncbi:MAG: glycosyltransferase [Bacteroidales bacterium]|nr:glycosyltransferase [Bacteroidales bacterium]
MRIAILSSFYPLRGGIAQFNASLYNELSKNNVVKAYTFSRQYPQILFPGKTQYVTKDDEAVPVESIALVDTVNPFTWVKAAKVISEFKPDILIMKYWMSWFGPSLGYVARRLKAQGCKVIPILDNVIPHEQRFFDKPLTKYFLSGTTGCVAMCDEVAADLLSIKPDSKYITLPHPLYSHFGEKLQRIECENKLGIRHGMKNILFFGLIRKYKGLDILIQAFDKLPNDYQLVIAGEPYGSFDEYQQLIDASCAKDRIFVFPNYIKDSMVKDYFSCADVTVLPYRSATQSGISSISYHFEVPMIVTDVGGLKSTVGDRGTGIVADVAEPECIRAEIERYFSDERIAKGCIENIRKEKDRLSWESFCNNLIEFSEKL